MGISNDDDDGCALKVATFLDVALTTVVPSTFFSGLLTLDPSETSSESSLSSDFKYNGGSGAKGDPSRSSDGPRWFL